MGEPTINKTQFGLERQGLTSLVKTYKQHSLGCDRVGKCKAHASALA